MSSLRLHVENGEHRCCFHERSSTVEVTLSVSPVSFVTPSRDFYSIVVLDPVGEIAYQASGSLTAGDLTVVLTPSP